MMYITEFIIFHNHIINELRRTLLSVSAQTENAHELIIVDGSKYQ